MTSSNIPHARDIGLFPASAYHGTRLWKNSWALIIGINEYRKPIKSLRCAENDATAIATILPSRGFPSENTLTLLASRDEITEARLSTIFSKEPFRAMGLEDRLLVYFAGHGVCAEYNKLTYGFLLLPDSEIEGDWPTEERPHLMQAPRNALEMQTFLQTIRHKAPKHKLLLLDTCFSGFMKMHRSATGYPAGPIDPSRWWQHPVMQVMTAGTDGQTAVEKQETGHGLFTEYILRGLGSAADSDCDGVISFPDLQQYIVNGIAHEGASQEPQEDREGDGRFVFLRSEVLDWPKLKSLILQGAELYCQRDFSGALLAWEQARALDPFETGLQRIAEFARAATVEGDHRWNVVLGKEGAYADCAHFPLSGCRRFALRIEIPKQSLYWRAGFALAPAGDVREVNDRSAFERYFVFHFGRGHLREDKSLMPTATLHLAAYCKQETLIKGNEFDWPLDHIEVAVEIMPEQNAVRVAFSDRSEQFELAASAASHLYLLAWADHYCSFRIPMGVEFLEPESSPPVYLAGQGSELSIAFREAMERNQQYGRRIGRPLGPVEGIQIRGRKCESQLFETGGPYRCEAVRMPASQTVWCVQGVILEKYREKDFRNWLGAPVSDETTAAPSRFGATGRFNHFEHGEIDYYETGGGGRAECSAGQAFAVNGAIGHRYIRMGGTGSTLGFPISDEHDALEGRQSDFEGGSLFWAQKENRVHLLTGALLPATGDPFAAGWRQYSGQSDPSCLTVSTEEAEPNSFLAFRDNEMEIGIRHELPSLKHSGCQPRYCALTFRSVGWVTWYTCIGHDGPADIYVACSSEQEKAGWPLYNEWTLPLPSGTGWRSVILDLQHEAFVGLGLVSYSPEWVCLRGYIDIGQIWLSDHLGLLRRSIPHPCLLTSGEIAVPSLQKGSHGGAVAKLQRSLREIGLFGHNTDGQFDSKTEAVVREFQRSQGLPVDGKVVRATWEELVRVLPAHQR